MSLREHLREYKTWTAVGAIGLLVLAVVLIRYQMSDGDADTTTPTPSARAFFTVDEGTTWFVESSKRIPPFDHNGSIAVRAYVFTCDGGKTKFTGYMERYTPKAKQMMEGIIESSGEVSTPPPAVIGGVELKKPGAREWVKAVDRTRAAEICSVPCDNGRATPVEPD